MKLVGLQEHCDKYMISLFTKMFWVQKNRLLFKLKINSIPASYLICFVLINCIIKLFTLRSKILHIKM